MWRLKDIFVAFSPSTTEPGGLTHFQVCVENDFTCGAISQALAAAKLGWGFLCIVLAVLHSVDQASLEIHLPLPLSAGM